MVTSLELRQERISCHSTVLRAIGGTGADLLALDNWKDLVRGLEAIDWAKKNKDWEGVCIVANSVVSNRQARTAAKAYIKRRLGLALSDAETKSLTSASEQAAVMQQLTEAFAGSTTAA
jgi:DNA sulfur modification protein DndB